MIVETITEHMEPLRVCRFCGIEAWLEEDLNLFKNSENALYGKDTKCKKCTTIYNRKYYKNNQLVDVFKQRSLDGIIRCHFCGESIEKLRGRYDGSVLMSHSLDGNHENWNPENKVPMHNRCHTKFHHPLSIQPKGELSPSWKGDNAKPKSIKERERREKNRDKFNQYKREWRRKRRLQNSD